MVEQLRNLMKEAKDSMSWLEIWFESKGIKVRLKLGIPFAFMIYVALIWLIQQTG